MLVKLKTTWYMNGVKDSQAITLTANGKITIL